MTRKPTTPSYRLHKPSGQAVVTLNYVDNYLGPHGSPESRAEYDRLIAEWLANGRRPRRPTPQVSEDEGPTINEVILAFWPHAERHYRHPDGTPTSELADYRLSLRPLQRLYGDTLARAFGPLSLKAFRQAIADGSWLTEEERAKRLKKGSKVDCCRGVVNQRVGRIRRMFRWAVEQELVSSGVYQALLAVRGLPVGRGQARESQPVKPVPDTFVAATLPNLRPQTSTMVQLQLLTGMRPGEVVRMRTMDLETSGDVWFYRPGSDEGAHGRHKTSWRGHDRVIVIGPKAQAVLRPWLRLKVEEFLFQPWEAETQRDQERARGRKTKRSASQVARQRERNPERAPGRRYTVTTYGRAIERAAEKAGVPVWNPGQLRHTHATTVRKQFGLEAAQVALGHQQANVTQLYAERDLALAQEVALTIG